MLDLGLIRAPPAGHDLCFERACQDNYGSCIGGYHNLPAGGGSEHCKTTLEVCFEKMVEEYEQNRQINQPW